MTCPLVYPASSFPLSTPSPYTNIPYYYSLRHSCQRLSASSLERKARLPQSCQLLSASGPEKSPSQRTDGSPTACSCVPSQPPASPAHAHCATEPLRSRYTPCGAPDSPPPLIPPPLPLGCSHPSTSFYHVSSRPPCVTILTLIFRVLILPFTLTPFFPLLTTPTPLHVM